MNNRVWIKCSQCNYSTEVLENEVWDYLNGGCALCEGKMILDYDKKTQKKEDEAPGDNFPVIPNREIEMRDSFGTLGMGHTWYFIEAIGDIKLRLQYRETFFKCGGVIPEREDLR
jgi:hypothetical protein